MKQIVFFQNIGKYQAEISAVTKDYEFIFTRDDPDWQQRVSEAEILVGPDNSELDKCLAAGYVPRWIQMWSAGIDTVDLRRLQEQDIILTTVSGIHAKPIAETVFAMMLAFSRLIHRAVRDQQEKRWPPYQGAERRNCEIHDKTIGILGYGNIGQEVAHIARAFGMRVLGLRRNAKGDISVAPDAMYAVSDIDQMLPQCDYVVNILPLTDETRGMINANRFGLMKPSACYISVGRGDTTNQNDLIAALQNKTIACAGLDVTTPEPLPASSPLWAMENVIITPHNAGGTEHYNRRSVAIFKENLAAYVADGKPCRNMVDYNRGY